MNVEHLLLRLGFEWVILLELQLDGLLLVGESFLDLSRVLGLYRSQIVGFRNLYIRSFSIIDDQWL